MTLYLRPATPDDAAAIAAIYEKHVRESAVSFEYEPPTPDQIRERMAAAGDRYPWIVCTDGPSVAGYAYANAHAVRAAFAWTVDVVIYISDAFHRRGVGRALYAALFETLRRQGYVTAMAAVTSVNTASSAFHESLGFSLAGKFENVGYKLGGWHGVNWYQLQLLPNTLAPSPARKLSELTDAERAEAFRAGEKFLRPSLQ